MNEAKTRYQKRVAQRLHTEAHQEARTSIREDKRKYIDDLANKAEDAANQGDMASLYSISRMLTNRRMPTSKPIRNKQGKILTSDSEQAKRWAEHFEEILNRPAPTEAIETREPEEELRVNCDKPSIEEIVGAIKKIKNNKASGPDNIPGEALKADPILAANILEDVFSAVWEGETIPEQWKEALIIKLPKKRRSFRM